MPTDRSPPPPTAPSTTSLHSRLHLPHQLPALSPSSPQNPNHAHLRHPPPTPSLFPLPFLPFPSPSPSSPTF
uniref:Uncharacterized protein n=1 Tax=Magnetospirillum gryphiswaldense TaxID=55518 RepID=A4U427_9PROT|nr:hypothetical protein MGR_0244 [Magnetospirillum gryphiswaldense MSR-1]